MDTLPEELLVHISTHCDHGSNKNLRLVARKWENASSPAVFGTLYLAVCEPGLAKLTDLSKSPLAKHVKHLVMFSDILPNWSKTNFLRAIDLRPDFSQWCRSRQGQGHSRDETRRSYQQLPRHHLNEEQLAAAWTSYLALVRDQKKWRHEQHGLHIKELLTSLPSLREVNVKCTTPFSGRTNEWPVWKRLRETIRVGPDDWMYATDHFDPDYAHATGHAALALIEAIGFRSTFFGIKPVTKLQLHSSHLGSYQDLFESQNGLRRNFTTDDAVPRSGSENRTPCYNRGSAHHNMRVDAFRNLTSLKLHVPHATLSTRLHGDGLRIETLQFLYAAKQVRDLDLRYTDDELSPDIDEEMPLLESLFASSDTVWPYLHRLSLATNLAAEVLLHFLRNHAATLTELDLRDMRIRGVEQAIEQMPRILKLQNVYMECLWDESPNGEFLSVLSRSTDWDEPYEQAVKAFLLRKIPRKPPLQWDGGHGSDIMSIGSNQAEPMEDSDDYDQ